jgi:hypothetical protein
MFTVKVSVPRGELVEQPISHHSRQHRIVRRQAELRERKFP